MAVAIRDDVAEGKPYNQLIERLLAERRRVTVYACPKDECPRSLFVFYQENTSLIALEYHVLLLLERTHPEHDPICTLNEELPFEVEARKD
jgi:hypothetical protein